MSFAKQKIRAARISLVSAGALTLLKLAAAAFTGSLAVLSSGVDSMLDILMSGVNYLAIRQAEQPPDPNHPFGHGKFETVATVLQSLVIALSGCWVLFESVRRLMLGSEVSNLEGGIAVLLISSGASWKISSFLKKTARETDSSALKADSLHFSMDVYTNLALMAGLAVIYLAGITWLDPILSILVGCYILFEAVRLLRHGMGDILDEQLPESIRNEITHVLEMHRQSLLDYHRLRTRRAGSQKIVDFHLTVCRHLTVEESHRIADHLEKRIRDKVPGADISIHVEPCRTEHCPGRDVCLEAVFRPGERKKT
ncbi:MAG: cation diffusion facilitator family transporter [Syntrophotaleaceae bacterium]